jgi:hypothetical protein
MAGHSRPKDGVASLAYVPAIHVFDKREGRKTWMPGTRPGMTDYTVKLVPQPQDAVAFGLWTLNEAPIRSSTKSISAPAM